MPHYERLYAGRAYPPNAVVEPIRREVADLRHRFVIGDRRQVRLLPVPEPPRADEQLAFDTLGFGDDAVAAPPASESRIA